jgi:hypothetical protein
MIFDNRRSGDAERGLLREAYEAFFKTNSLTQCVSKAKSFVFLGLGFFSLRNK